MGDERWVWVNTNMTEDLKGKLLDVANYHRRSIAGMVRVLIEKEWEAIQAQLVKQPLVQAGEK